MRVRSVLRCTLLALLLCAPGAWASPPDSVAFPAETPIGLRAIGAVPGTSPVSDALLGVRAWAPPAAVDTASTPATNLLPAFAAPMSEGPTLDSLQMSAWERVWWGRQGIFRRTGLFPTHEDPADDFRQIAHVRRWMLAKHQLLGLATVGVMAATVVGGQLAISGHDARFHKTIAPITIGMYSATAALSLLAPPNLYTGGRGGVDTITIHRWLAVGHLLGMIATPLLAPDEVSERRLHQVLGYSTFATFSAAMITVTFFR